MSFEILPGLPPYGPPAISFTRHGSREFREGLVVRFCPSGSEPWIGNFLGGSTSCKAVLQHPNGSDVIVVADGEAHIVAPRSRELRDRFGDDIEEVRPLPALRSILFRRLTHFETIAADNSRWCSQRISWDGFRNVDVRGTMIVGEAWTAVDEAWVPFTLDLATRQVRNAIYDMDMARAVRVVPRAD
jgi:hypothetical protein